MSVLGPASLAVAALDLSLVRTLRAAMHAADIASGRGMPASGLGPAPTLIRPRPQAEPAPHILPRKVIEPTPRFEPRRVIHLAPRVEPAVSDHVCPPVHPEPVKTKSPLEPPWRQLPWEQAPAERITIVKRPPPRVDTPHKGMLIDLFL